MSTTKTKSSCLDSWTEVENSITAKRAAVAGATLAYTRPHTLRLRYTTRTVTTSGALWWFKVARSEKSYLVEFIQVAGEWEAGDRRGLMLGIDTSAESLNVISRRVEVGGWAQLKRDTFEEDPCEGRDDKD